jgi:hypothetical protein
VPYRRGRTSIPGHQHMSAFFSDGPELSPWAATTDSQPGTRGIHRIVRLALACGVAAAGLCLILGMTALAITVGSPGPSSDSPDDAVAAFRQVSNDGGSQPRVSRSPAGTSRAHHRARHGGPVVATRAGRTIARAHGATQPVHARFSVAGPGAWGLSWTFRCPAGRTGHLVIQEFSKKPGKQAEFDRSGRTGRGTIWLFRDPGYHSLIVTSNCPWAVRVVLARGPAPRS